MTQISEYSLLLWYETKTRKHQPFRTLHFPPNKEQMNTWLQVNLKNAVRGMFFPAPQSASTFHTFSYSQQSETKITWGDRYGDVCICMPNESDSPPVSWGEWIGGAPTSNVHFVSQAMHLIPLFFHWPLFILIIDYFPIFLY